MSSHSQGGYGPYGDRSPLPPQPTHTYTAQPAHPGYPAQPYSYDSHPVLLPQRSVSSTPHRSSGHHASMSMYRSPSLPQSQYDNVERTSPASLIHSLPHDQRAHRPPSLPPRPVSANPDVFDSPHRPYEDVSRYQGDRSGLGVGSLQTRSNLYQGGPDLYPDKRSFSHDPGSHPYSHLPPHPQLVRSRTLDTPPRHANPIHSQSHVYLATGYSSPQASASSSSTSTPMDIRSDSAYSYNSHQQPMIPSEMLRRAAKSRNGKTPQRKASGPPKAVLGGPGGKTFEEMMAARSLSEAQTETSQVKDENGRLRTGILEGDRSSTEKSAKVNTGGESQTEETGDSKGAGGKGGSKSQETESEKLKSGEVTWRGRGVLVGVPKHDSWSHLRKASDEAEKSDTTASSRPYTENAKDDGEASPNSASNPPGDLRLSTKRQASDELDLQWDKTAHMNVESPAIGNIDEAKEAVTVTTGGLNNDAEATIPPRSRRASLAHDSHRRQRSSVSVKSHTSPSSHQLNELETADSPNPPVPRTVRTMTLGQNPFLKRALREILRELKEKATVATEAQSPIEHPDMDTPSDIPAGSGSQNQSSEREEFVDVPLTGNSDDSTQDGDRHMSVPESHDKDISSDSVDPSDVTILRAKVETITPAKSRDVTPLFQRAIPSPWKAGFESSPTRSAGNKTSLTTPGEQHQVLDQNQESTGPDPAVVEARQSPTRIIEASDLDTRGSKRLRPTASAFIPSPRRPRPKADTSLSELFLRPAAPPFVPRSISHTSIDSTGSENIAPSFSEMHFGSKTSTTGGFAFKPHLANLRPSAQPFVPRSISGNSRASSGSYGQSEVDSRRGSVVGPSHGGTVLKPTASEFVPSTKRKGSQQGTDDSRHSNGLQSVGPSQLEGPLVLSSEDPGARSMGTPKQIATTKTVGSTTSDDPRNDRPEKTILARPSEQAVLQSGQLARPPTHLDNSECLASAITDTYATVNSNTLTSRRIATPTPLDGNAQLDRLASSPVQRSPVSHHTSPDISLKDDQSPQTEPPDESRVYNGDTPCRPEIKVDGARDEQRFREWVFPSVDQYGRRPSISRRHTMATGQPELPDLPDDVFGPGIASTLAQRVDSLRSFLGAREGNDFDKHLGGVSARTSAEFPIRAKRPSKTLVVRNATPAHLTTPPQAQALSPREEGQGVSPACGLEHNVADIAGDGGVHVGEGKINIIFDILERCEDLLVDSARRQTAEEGSIKGIVQELKKVFGEASASLAVKDNNEAATARESLDAVRSSLDQLNTAISAQTGDLAVLKQQQVDVQQAISATPRQAPPNAASPVVVLALQRSLETKLAEIALANDSLQHRLDTLLQQKEDENIRAIESRNDAHAKTIATQQSEIQIMTAKLAMVQSELDRHKTKVEEGARAKKSFEDQIQAMEDSLESQQVQAKETAKSLDEMSASRHAAESERDALAMALREAHAERAEDQDQILGPKQSVEIMGVQVEEAKAQAKTTEQISASNAAMEAAILGRLDDLARIASKQKDTESTELVRERKRNVMLAEQIETLQAKLDHAAFHSHEQELASAKALADSESDRKVIEARLSLASRATTVAEERALKAETALAIASQEKPVLSVMLTERQSYARTADIRLQALAQENVYWRQFALESDRRQYTKYMASNPFTNTPAGPVRGAGNETSPPDERLDTPYHTTNGAQFGGDVTPTKGLNGTREAESLVDDLEQGVSPVL